jgi:hypothetical protein
VGHALVVGWKRKALAAPYPRGPLRTQYRSVYGNRAMGTVRQPCTLERAGNYVTSLRVAEPTIAASYTLRPTCTRLAQKFRQVRCIKRVVNVSNCVFHDSHCTQMCSPASGDVLTTPEHQFWVISDFWLPTCLIRKLWGQMRSQVINLF